MRKILISFVTLIVLFMSILTPVASADGFFHIYDQDIWSLTDEEQQYCAINYKNGIQNMILTVDTGQGLTGEKAVWIFPVPAEPGETEINIIRGFPKLTGYDIEERASESISTVFKIMRLTQIYTFPLNVVDMFFGVNLFGSLDIGEVTVHESIERMGLTTELVSTDNAYSLTRYLTSKGLTLPKTSRSMLDEYVGQEYSFVISWISNVEQFKTEQGKLRNKVWFKEPSGDVIGVYIAFPTDKIYYPLKPTSVYGNKTIPAVIYVLDYVEPELYAEIKKDTEINYFFESRLSASEELRDFFTGYNIEPSTVYSLGGDQPGVDIKDIEYTKIKVTTPSKNFTQDLWMNVSAPVRVVKAYFANRYGLVYGLAFFVLCSCLASLLSARIVFGAKKISKNKFLLFGLWNFLTLLGFSIAAYVAKVDRRFTQSQECQENDISFGKIVRNYLLITLAISSPVLLFLDSDLFSYWTVSTLITILIVYIVFAIFLAPFVWGYYKNRQIMKFIILFTMTFVALTGLTQVLMIMIM